MKALFASLPLRPVMVLLLIASMALTACDSGNATAVPPTNTTAPAAPAATDTTAPAAAAATNTAPAAAAATNTAPAAAAATNTAPAASSGTGGTNGGFKLNTSVSGTIDFWHFWSSPVRRNTIRRVIGECSKELPNLKVNETAKPFGDIWTANTAAVAAGSGMPDVIVEDRPKLPQAAANGVESNLGPMAKKDGVDGSTFWPFTWQQTLYKGDPYGIPYSTDVRVLYYNISAFKEVGLDPTKPPTKWSDLEAMADKLDKKNPNAPGGYDRIAFVPLINSDWDVWGYTNGFDGGVTADGKPDINDPKMVETMTWEKKWIDRYGGWANLQKFRGQFGSPPNDAFMSGKVAMVADINGYVSQLNFFRPQYTDPSGKKSNMEWGVAQLPYNTKPADWSGGFALSIPKGAAHPDAAWEFIKCATGPAAQSLWAQGVYDIPANIAAANDPVVLADANYKVGVDAMQFSTGGNYLAGYPNYGEQVAQREEDMWTGKKDIKAALDEAQKAIEDQIAKNPAP